MKNIYLVDDEKDFLIILSSYLKDKDYKVSLFETSKAALVESQINRPDLIITDVYIEDPTSGLDLANNIKEIDKTIPVIVLTGMDTRFVESYKPCKANVILKKPYNKNLLLTEIERLTHGQT